MSMFRYCVLFFCLSCIVFPTSGQTTAFRNFTHKDGLPSSETYCVTQDSKGFIWVCTDRGIVKFDGYQFTTFTGMDGLPDNTVFEIIEDKKKRLWLNTYSSRIGYLENDIACEYPYNPVIKSVLPYQLLNGLFIGENDDIWFQKKDDREIPHLSRIDAKGVLHNVNPKNVKRIYISRKGKCFLSGPISPGSREIIQLETGEQIGNISFDASIMGNFQVSPPDSSGTFLFFAQGKAWQIDSSGNKLLFTFNGDLLSVYVDENKNILLGFRHLGLKMYTKNTAYKESRWLMTHVSPTSIYKDREGGLWMTSLEKGLFYFFPHLPIWYTEQDGLSSSKINGIEAWNDYRFLLMANEKMIILKGDKPFALEKHERVDSVLDIDLSADTRLFLTGNGQAKKLPGIKQTQLGFGKKVISGNSSAWVITHAEVMKYDQNGFKEDSISFLKISRPTCLFQLADDRLLIGTLDGLYIRDKGGIRFWGSKHPLLGQRISSIRRIDGHHLILTTIGHGVIVIHQDSARLVHHYTTEHGLPSMMCNSAYVEKNGVVWVATNRGICRIKGILYPASASFRTLDLNDGLVSNEVNEILIIKDDIWLATLHGLSILPKKITDARQVPIPIYITQVNVNDFGIDPDSAGNLSPEQNTLRISFAGLHFWHPEKLVYQYRLKGTDSNWYNSKDRFVIYNSLAPGDYKFEVRVIKPDGSLSPGTASFSFHIQPEFYQTSWFYLLAALLLTGVIWSVLQRRVKFVRRQEQLKNELSQFHEKALRNQMNPHFVYNALNSIQNSILRKDTLHSASLLAKFSRLMRLTFNNTSQDRISLAEELAALNLYVDLEKIRFENAFHFSVVTDPRLNPVKVLVPPLLIQPFVENSILHGISTRTDGEIIVTIKPIPDRLFIQITDNGVGRKESGRIKEKKRKYAGPIFIPDNLRHSSGVKTTASRIFKLWPKNTTEPVFQIIDLYDGENKPAGTKVEFYIPLQHD